MKDYDKTLRYKLRLIWEYKDVLRNHCRPVTEYFIRRFRNDQLVAARRLKDKEKIEVAFLLTIPGMWKLDYLFRQLRELPRYHPYVVIYPYSFYKGFSPEEVQATLERTKKFIADKGFEYHIPYDEKRKKWLDVKTEYHPDIVFFTSPYKDFPKRYSVYRFRHTLTCYVPYGFCSLRMDQTNYNLIFHNLVGMYFLETKIHQQLAQTYARNKGENTMVSGYPGTEVFLRKDYIPHYDWKPQPHPKKRIIWAPHHTVTGDVSVSNFLAYSEYMFRLAEKYKDEVQWVFKPHPLLKFKLQQIWGVKETLDYYQRWDALDYTQLEEINYVDLFLTSDAMIHDCGSFAAEYLFLHKPVMYLVKEGMQVEIQFNPFGEHTFAQHYHGYSENDIERFLREVVIEGKDSMRESRQAFFEEYLAPRDGLMPSEKIIRLMEEKINGKI